LPSTYITKRVEGQCVLTLQPKRSSEDGNMLSAPLLSRRNLLLRSSAALTLPNGLFAASAEVNPFAVIVSAPTRITAFAEQGTTELQRSGETWNSQAGVPEGIEIVFKTGEQAAVTLQSPRSPLLRIHLRWQLTPPPHLRYLGDQWVRSYGDLAWRHTEPERILPWYFLATDGTTTHACGVRTGPAALCFWQVDPGGVSLWLDVRNGGRGVQLGNRELTACGIVTESYSGITPFAASARFCRVLCAHPRLPDKPVYGGNNWYYAYGKSSAQAIREDSERVAAFASSTDNRPFMVIDDGWSPNPTAGPWSHGNSAFADMPQLSQDMRQIGVQPGIWVRPLFTQEDVASAWRLQSPNAIREYKRHQASTLDPTVPEVLEKVRLDIRTAAAWGYRLIKHDFSTYDLLGRWGFSMGAQITDDDWSFASRNRTNAEVILDFYTAVREAAGAALLLGCNTVGHLSAGLFELQRTGDDTSGRDWNRTRKMGVNTLGFRAAQHNAFFAVDADCVGITRDIPWELNRQWLDLLSRSGTPLFVSAAPTAVGAEQREALRRAFQVAASPASTGEPLDWLENTEPQRWRLSGQTVTYDWFGTAGASPFAG
jgi:alpha-galactosidase